MMALVVCSVVLATLAHFILVGSGRPRAAVRWARAPYRSVVPVDLVDHPIEDDVPVVVQVGAWSSLVSGFVLTPGLGWALATMPLGAFAPAVAMWMALAMAHLWCAKALLKGDRRALTGVRTVALATLAIATPFSLMCLAHLVSLGAADHDPCVPSLRARLVASVVCLAHAVLLLVASAVARARR
jgi:hypothetical protein